jgi:hypothetical protein
MDFMIFDSAGNAVESFETQRDAVVTLVDMAAQDPAVAQHLAVLAFDDEGEAVGEPITVADVRPDVATTLVMVGDSWLLRERLTVHSRWPRASRIPPVLGACQPG